MKREETDTDKVLGLTGIPFGVGVLRGDGESLNCLCEENKNSLIYSRLPGTPMLKALSRVMGFKGTGSGVDNLRLSPASEEIKRHIAKVLSS